MIKPMN